MPDFANGYINSFNPALYAGPILFREGRADSPLLSMIGSRRRTTNSELFIVGQHYNAPVAGDSVTSEFGIAGGAPDFAPIGRKQTTNLTQIHSKSLKWTDYSVGNRGMLAGPNLAGQTGNPNSDVDFQRANKVLELRLDIEHDIINSKYHFRDGNGEDANRTRGLIETIQTNTLDVKGAEMSWNHLNEMLIAMGDRGLPTHDLILGCNHITATQLAIEAKAERFEITNGLTKIGGIGLTEIHTLRGTVRIVNLNYLPDGVALLLNIPAISIVEQPFPNGNWTWFSLGRQGASEVEMLTGAWGLDPGYEGLHAMFTNIATGYEPYKGTKVFINNPAVPTTEVAAVLKKAVLAGAQAGVETAALDLEYTGVPTAEPTLTYQWKISNTASGLYSDIEGATGATYTPTAEQVGKYIRCDVTATETATGSTRSNVRKVLAAE